jgi:outer membrane biosynthesis protein TonB
MSTASEGAEPALRIANRRLRARRSISSLAYIDLGEKNGGIIVNLSEGGLALAAAAPVDTDAPARMLFQLPGSSDRLAALGEITWISESKKEAGLRFVDLSEDVRSRITGWISREPSPAQLDREDVALAGTVRPAGRSVIPSSKNAITEFAGTNQPASEETQISTAATETDLCSQAGEPLIPLVATFEQPSVSNSASVERQLPERLDRRGHVRRAVPSLAYIDLGENNGGIILNLGEGGLAVTTAAPLYVDGPAQLQFQLPGSGDWLKVGGEIRWVSKSKREAGWRFVELPDNARDRIASWLSSVKLESEGVGSREKFWRRLEMPTVRMPQTVIPATNTSPTFPGTTTPRAASDLLKLDSQPSSGTATNHSFVAAAEAHSGKVLSKRTWVTLAMIVFLGAFTSFLAGWFELVPGSWMRILTRFGKSTSKTSEIAGLPPAGPVAGVPSLSLEDASPPTNEPPDALLSKDGNSITPSVSSTRTEGPREDLLPSKSSVVGADAGTAKLEEQLRKPSQSAAANALVAAGQNGLPPGPQSAASITPPSPTLNQLQDAKTTGDNSVAATTETPETVTPSFSVSFNPYPSIRVPAGFKSQQGARMEIGRLLSRVDPIYPEDAKTQRVEGTVKLHILVGPDGSVESVEPISGPASLIPAATNAIRQWRYTDSSIGNQPVEFEEDVAITFRLVTEAAHPN